MHVDDVGNPSNRKCEYSWVAMEPIIKNDTRTIVAVSDGSLMRKTQAAYAMRAVQNLQAGAQGGLKGDSSIAKAELVGAWLQLKASMPKVEEGYTFHGYVDNQGVVRVLQALTKMPDRQIKRARQGHTFLREMRGV